MLDYWGAGILTKDDRARERPVVTLKASEWRHGRRHLDPMIFQPRLEDQLRPVLNHAAGIERIEPAKSTISHIDNRHSSFRVVPEVEEL